MKKLNSSPSIRQKDSSWKLLTFKKKKKEKGKGTDALVLLKPSLSLFLLQKYKSVLREKQDDFPALLAKVKPQGRFVQRIAGLM